jgi:hypothetical protein
MRILLAFIFALIVGSAVNSAQAATEDSGRWCVISSQDNSRHCYFQKHRDCEKAVADGSGVCQPNEKNRGVMPEDKSK